MTKLSADLLAACLDDLGSRRRSMEECLAAHPGVAEELGGLLEVARAVAPPPPVAPDASFRARGRAALLESISDKRMSVTKSSAWRFWRGVGDLERQLGPRLVGAPALVALLVVALVATAGGAVYAAQPAVPGDALYPLKIAVEEVQLVLAVSDASKAETYLRRADRRLEEIETAGQSKRGESAQMAAEAFVEMIAKSEQQLARVATHGARAAGDGVERTARLVSMSARLGAVQTRIPEPARAAVSRAAERAAAGLMVSSQSAQPSSAQAPRSDNTPTLALTSSPTSVVVLDTGTPGEVPNDVADGPAATATARSAARVALTEAISDVQTLAADPALPGQSQAGLLAHLRAAQAALGRDQEGVAVRNLDAFLGELNALHQGGHLDVEGYEALYARYRALVGALGGIPQEQIIGVRPAPRLERVETTPGPTPLAGDDRTVHRPTPVATRTETERTPDRPGGLPVEQRPPATRTPPQTEAPTPETGRGGVPQVVPSVAPGPREAPTEVAPPPSPEPRPHLQEPPGKDPAPGPGPAPDPRPGSGQGPAPDPKPGGGPGPGPGQGPGGPPDPAPDRRGSR